MFIFFRWDIPNPQHFFNNTTTTSSSILLPISRIYLFTYL